MNIIARHTLRSISKNPLQSVIIVFSIVIITACLLFSFCVKSIFYETAWLWAYTHFKGCDLRVEFMTDSECSDLIEVLNDTEDLQYYGVGNLGGRYVQNDDETLASTLYWVSDLDALNTLTAADLIASCDDVEGAICVSVSVMFAEKLGVWLGDTVRYNISASALSSLGTDYLDVVVTQIYNNTGAYYPNGSSQMAYADYSDLPAAGIPTLYSMIYLYLDEPYALTDSGRNRIDAVADELQSYIEGVGGIRYEDGYTENTVETSVRGSMETLTIALVVIIMLMAVLLYSSYAVVARSRSDELIKFKAAGATPLQSIFILFAEVAVYLVAGCCLGLGVGVGLVRMLQGVLNRQIVGIVVEIATWKYFAAMGIAMLAASVSCIVPAARMGLKSVRALKSDSAHVTRRAPWWVAVLSTLLFAGAMVSLFLASDDNLMPAMIVFLCATVVWAICVVPYLLRILSFVVGKIVSRREGHIAAMEIPNNAGVNNVAVILSLLLTFVWTGFCIINVVKMTGVASAERYTADYIVTSSLVTQEDAEARLDELLQIDGFTDGTYYKTVTVYYLEKDGAALDYVGQQGILLPDGESMRHVTREYDTELAELFDNTENPIIVHYSIMARDGLVTGDKVRVRVWSMTGATYIDGEFTVIGADYDFTAYDEIVFLRLDDFVRENGVDGDLLINFWLNGEGDFSELRLQTDRDGCTLYKVENYYAYNSMNEMLAEILDVFVYIIFGVTAIGLINLIAVSATERKRELAVYRLSGMTTGGTVRMTFAEALLTAFIGFVIGLLFCMGVNQTKPVLARIVNRYLPRTLFDVNIVYICLVGAGIVFVGWLLMSVIAAVFARRSHGSRNSNGIMTE